MNVKACGTKHCFFSSSIGRKVIVALTGFLLIGFVVAHLLGNLQMFLGQEAINAYANSLHELGPILWVARIGLIAIFILHVGFSIALTRENNNARPVHYKVKNFRAASPASRYMAHLGMIIFAFVVIHLLHFTFGIMQPEYSKLIDSSGRADVYSMVVHGFQHLGFSTGYVIALLALGFHLSHGIQSVFQTVGFHHKAYVSKIKVASNVVGWALALGYISIPLAVSLGVITLPIGG